MCTVEAHLANASDEGLSLCHAVTAVGGDHKLAFCLGFDAVLLHELANPVFAHPDATRQQVLVHARPAVFALDLGVDGTDMHKQGLVC